MQPEHIQRLVDVGLTFTIMVGIIYYLLRENKWLKSELRRIDISRDDISKGASDALNKNSYVLESLPSSISSVIRNEFNSHERNLRRMIDSGIRKSNENEKS